ncbi:hypothetical protein DXA13_00480 [Clostridium sp. AM58-1XD]|nr:hypothetical protein DXA13_00480 [Clostridium sp. AM58-1XD]
MVLFYNFIIIHPHSIVNYFSEYFSEKRNIFLFSLKIAPQTCSYGGLEPSIYQSGQYTSTHTKMVKRISSEKIWFKNNILN